MRDHILAMRRSMFGGLEGHVEPAMRQRYVEQHGMCTYPGLTVEQVDILKEQYGVYLLRSGRMCVAGLNRRNVDTVVAAIAAVVKKAT